ncbi:MAG: hypothetical protein LBC11_01030 [Puniceicoccales bacterium]|jgi:hypothetical protein|nr:hypothetical protein [Puniceicoccales bacterium]
MENGRKTKNRRIGNIIFFMVGLLVVFARLSTVALPLFNGDGSLTEGSKYLCQSLGIDDKVTNAQQFTEFFRTNFLKKGKEESWEKYVFLFKFDENIFDENTYGKLLQKLIKSCGLLGMKQAVFPKKTKYDYVIIFGSSTKDMTIVCQFIRNEMANIIGNNPDTKIFFMTSQRPLDPMFESAEIERLKDSSLPQTEIHAVQLIWERELGKYPFSCEFVDGEQFVESLDLSPGAMVVVSGNPLIALRDNVFQNILGQRWFESGGTLETVGPADNLYHDRVNYIKNQNNKRAVQRYMIWGFIDIITSCAIEEFEQLTVKK